MSAVGRAGRLAEAGPGPSVEEISTLGAFAPLAPEWDALAAATDDQVFYRHDFVGAWLASFAADARLRVLTLRAADGSLEGALPLVKRQVRWHGIPLRELASATNWHSCRFDLLARDPRAAASRLLAHLAADRSWDVLRLADVPEDGSAFALLRRAEALGHPVGVWESHRSPFLALPASLEQVHAGLDSGFRANLRRRRARLERRGAVCLERVAGPPGLARALEEAFALEAGGWKGRAGTAINQEPSARAFYAALARGAAARGALALYFLRLNGRAVACGLALVHAGRCLLLKTAYDEAAADCSPGHLLVEDVLRDCMERGLGEFDFLGESMDWKRCWTSAARRHFWLFVFRADRWGQALRDLKFTWTPLVKDWVGRWMP